MPRAGSPSPTRRTPALWRFRSALLALAITLGAAGCTRAVAVGTGDVQQSFRIEVHNESAETLAVSYNDGRGDALLGTVASGRSEPFIIVSPATTTITVSGRASSGRTAGPQRVTLSSGSVSRVVLR